MPQVDCTFVPVTWKRQLCNIHRQTSESLIDQFSILEDTFERHNDFKWFFWAMNRNILLTVNLPSDGSVRRAMTFCGLPFPKLTLDASAPMASLTGERSDSSDSASRSGGSEQHEEHEEQNDPCLPLSNLGGDFSKYQECSTVMVQCRTPTKRPIKRTKLKNMTL